MGLRINFENFVATIKEVLNVDNPKELSFEKLYNQIYKACVPYIAVYNGPFFHDCFLWMVKEFSKPSISNRKLYLCKSVLLYFDLMTKQKKIESSICDWIDMEIERRRQKAIETLQGRCFLVLEENSMNIPPWAQDIKSNLLFS